MKATLVAVLALNLSACADLRYYWQSVSGHVALLHAAKPVDDWLADSQTPEPLKAKLLLTQKIRQFAVTELKLPDNPSYKSYADLQRKAVVWNVVAAPAFSLKLKTWCFPVAGCVNYKGYFSQDEAHTQAERLKQQGWEVSVYGVPAYSTLGWSNWAGGDPLLNTFVGYPEGELARLVFHELAHQVVYVPDDTAFNESFATAVERLGSARWLLRHGSEAANLDYALFDQRRQQFRALTRATRLQLTQIYMKNQAVDGVYIAYTAMNNIAKEGIYRQFRAHYEELKSRWGGYTGYDAWVKNANNASFGALAAYDDWVPAFEALFEKNDGDWLRFYVVVKDLAKLSKEQRRQALMNIAQSA
ncbi:MAG TPA: aminopeptidase [Burkholderiaceae bacterium]|nr:aminopeptidase [Burkholderiaceae bacterium]